MAAYELSTSGMAPHELARMADLLDHLVAEIEPRRMHQCEVLEKALELVACQREAIAGLDRCLDQLRFYRARLARTMIENQKGKDNPEA